MSTDGRHRPAVTTPDAATALPLHLLVLVAALAAAVLGQGAYYPAGQRLVAVTLALATVAALHARPWTRDDARLAPLVAGAALAGWAVLSAAL
ncbi:MAG TPA: hypothetical protein VFN05_16135, partial [Actinomycetes bacterium]|nr:hypothetical protein [Actinomycetes bacterium]